jgi:uncharacterized membrane protein
VKISYAIVDEFYSDPDAMRNLALTVGQWQDVMSDGVYTYSQETANEFWNADLVRQFEAIIGAKLVFDPRKMSFGVFSYYDARSSTDKTTHFDDTEWSSIVYLVRPESCSGGLSFFRHRATGLTGPPDDSTAQCMGYSDRREFLDKVYFPDKLHTEAWEEIEHVPMMYNRLILLRSGTLFHRAVSGFGTTPEDARLTQRFFFNQAEAQSV